MPHGQGPAPQERKERRLPVVGWAVAALLRPGRRMGMYGPDGAVIPGERSKLE